MANVLYGALGVFLALLLLSGGFFLGWRASAKINDKTAQREARELSEQERKRLIEDQAAFSQLLNYNADTAYGLQDTPEFLTKEKG